MRAGRAITRGSRHRSLPEKRKLGFGDRSSKSESELADLSRFLPDAAIESRVIIPQCVIYPEPRQH